MRRPPWKERPFPRKPAPGRCKALRSWPIHLQGKCIFLAGGVGQGSPALFHLQTRPSLPGFRGWTTSISQETHRSNRLPARESSALAEKTTYPVIKIIPHSFPSHLTSSILPWKASSRLGLCLRNEWQVFWSQSTPPPYMYAHVLEGSIPLERSFLDECS